MRKFFPFVFSVICGCSTQFPSEIVSVPEGIESGKFDDKSVVVAPMHGAEEGVYFFKNGFSSLILELSDKRYRYWFSSDELSDHEPTYPLTGRYIVDGAIVRLQHVELWMQDVWVFRKLNGQTTLWRPGAVKAWHKERGFDFYGILYPTKLRPTDIWQKEVYKSKP
jgi:hypothetical protein